MVTNIFYYSVLVQYLQTNILMIINGPVQVLWLLTVYNTLTYIYIICTPYTLIVFFHVSS